MRDSQYHDAHEMISASDGKMDETGTRRYRLQVLRHPGSHGTLAETD